MTASSPSPPRPVLLRKRSNGMYVRLSEREATGYDVFHAVAAGSSSAADDWAADQADDSSAQVDAQRSPDDRFSHLHSAGGHAAGLLPRPIDDRTLESVIAAVDPWTAKRVAPPDDSSVAAAPARAALPLPATLLSSFASSPATPVQTAPSTLAQWEGLTRLTSPGDSTLALSLAPTQARPADMPSFTSSTTAPSATKRKVDTDSPDTPVLPPWKRRILERQKTEKEKAEELRIKKNPKASRKLAIVAAELNAALAADVQRLGRAVVVDGGSQDEPAPTPDELARMRLRQTLLGVRAFFLRPNSASASYYEQEYLRDKVRRRLNASTLPARCLLTSTPVPSAGQRPRSRDRRRPLGRQRHHARRRARQAGRPEDVRRLEG